MAPGIEKLLGFTIERGPRPVDTVYEDDMAGNQMFDSMRRGAKFATGVAPLAAAPQRPADPPAPEFSQADMLYGRRKMPVNGGND